MNMSLQVEWKAIPINPRGYGKTPAQRLKEEIWWILRKKWLTLEDYLISIACGIEPTQHLNEAICDDVLGGLGEAGGFRERAASSSESESDDESSPENDPSNQEDAFDVNFDFLLDLNNKRHAFCNHFTCESARKCKLVG